MLIFLKKNTFRFVFLTNGSVFFFRLLIFHPQTTKVKRLSPSFGGAARFMPRNIEKG
jgi:hypothetical protein